MSMQIGLTPLNPGIQRDIRHGVSRQAEVKRVDIASYLPWNQNSASNAELDIRAIAREFEHVSHYLNRRLQFVVDHESNEVLVKVIDNETDKVIKVLPPEELQRLHGRNRETLGFFFDQLV